MTKNKRTKYFLPNYFVQDCRSAETYKKLNWEPISRQYKAIHELAPKYLTDMFTLCQNNKYTLRSNGRKLNLTKPLTNFRKKSLSHTVEQ